MWALLDIPYLANRAYHSCKGIGNAADFRALMLYRVFEQIRTITADPRVRTSQIACCFDSAASYRKHFWDGYKRRARNDPRRNEVKNNIQWIRNFVMPECGFLCLHQHGLEADDMLAQAADQLAMRGKEGVIVTADGDLWQAIKLEVPWWDPARDLWMGYHDFVIKKRVEPHVWATVKALAGCPTDCVPGVKGVGEVIAVRYLLKDLKPENKRRWEIESTKGRRLFKRNWQLVALPHNECHAVELTPPRYNAKAFWKIARNNAMTSYLERGPRRTAWEDFFAGKLQTPGPQTPRRPGQTRQAAEAQSAFEPARTAAAAGEEWTPGHVG